MRDYNAAIEDNRQEAKQIGVQEGKQEKSIEIAKNMLSDGMDINLVAKYTNLSLDEIKHLS